MGDSRRALQSFVAGRHSSYFTQFYIPHGTSSSSRAELRKALSLKSLERRLVLPMAEGEWVRALEVLSAGYARAARTPEHFQRVIRLMVEREAGGVPDGTSIGSISSGPASAPFVRARENVPYSHAGSLWTRPLPSSSLLMEPLDTLRGKAYTGDIPSNSSLYLTFIWAYCSIGAPLHAMETFFQCLRRTRLSPAAREHALQLLLPCLCNENIREEGCDFFRQGRKWENLFMFFSPGSSSSKLPLSIHSTLMYVLEVAGASPSQYSGWLLEGAALDGNWQEALRYAKGWVPPLHQDDVHIRKEKKSGVAEGTPSDGRKEQQESYNMKTNGTTHRNEAMMTRMTMSMGHISPEKLSDSSSRDARATPSLCPQRHYLHAAPAEADEEKKREEEKSMFLRTIQTLADTLSPAALEKVLISALQDAAEEEGKEGMLVRRSCSSFLPHSFSTQEKAEKNKEEEQPEPWSNSSNEDVFSFSSYSLTNPSALLVARELWNAVFPHRTDVLLSERLSYSMMNVLGAMSAWISLPANECRRGSTSGACHSHHHKRKESVCPRWPEKSRSEGRDDSLLSPLHPHSWMELIYWFLYLFLSPAKRHVIPPSASQRDMKLDKGPPVTSTSPSSLTSSSLFFSSSRVVDVGRYIPLSSSSFFGGTAVVATNAAGTAKSSSSFYPVNNQTFFFHLPSPSQVVRYSSQEEKGTTSASSCCFLDRAANSDSGGSGSEGEGATTIFPLSDIAINMVFGAYPAVAEPCDRGHGLGSCCTHVGNIVHCTTTATPPLHSPEEQHHPRRNRHPTPHLSSCSSSSSIPHEDDAGVRFSSPSGYLPPLIMLYPKQMISLWNDLLSQARDITITPFVVSRVAPALVQLGETQRASGLLDEIIQKQFLHSEEKFNPLSLSSSSFVEENERRRVPEGGVAWKRVMTLENSSSPPPSTPTELQRTLLQMRSAISLHRPGHAMQAEGVRKYSKNKEKRKEREEDLERTDGKKSEVNHDVSVKRSVWERNSTSSSISSLPNRKMLFSMEEKREKVEDEEERKKILHHDDHHQKCSSLTLQRVPAAHAMVNARVQEWRYEMHLKDHFLQYYHQEQGRRSSFPFSSSFSTSPMRSLRGGRRNTPPRWHPDLHAEKDPRPPPIGLHDKASGWNHVGRGGEKVFFNSRRTPHPFSMWPKVMRSLGDPYRTWRLKENSSIGHRENVKKWNGRSSV